MKCFLKYLLFIIAAVALWNSADMEVSSTEEAAADISLVKDSYNSFISQQESNFNLPRQTSVSSGPNLQCTARRTSNLGRSNVEFAKSGKVVNAVLRYSIQWIEIIIHASFVEPSHRLLSLGRLII